MDVTKGSRSPLLTLRVAVDTSHLRVRDRATPLGPAGLGSGEEGNDNTSPGDAFVKITSVSQHASPLAALGGAMEALQQLGFLTRPPCSSQRPRRVAAGDETTAMGMASPIAKDDDGRDESTNQRMDRNWVELLQELRVTQMGVQILGGFLFTLAFQARFEHLDGFQRGMYIGLLVLAATTILAGMAPVYLHRALFRMGLKPSPSFSLSMSPLDGDPRLPWPRY
jgi:hypothetical protein